MVQKEAAQRLCAKVGTRESGAITVGVNYHGSVKKLFDVSRGSFMPAPNVDSAVIRIDINNDKKLPAETEKLFFEIVKCGFSQRRKTLVNSLTKQMNLDKEIVLSSLNDNNIKHTVRIEELSMDLLKNLAVSIKNKL
jgi:16S rRNA (adenine1518-N6/adenine1519-N6)-dimethyltransferase